MPVVDVNREAESRAVATFLASACNGPAGLLLEGEAGIGKTTLLLAVIDAARQKGFRVLAARSAAAESVLAYAVLSDLLTDVDPAAYADMPDAQRLAIDRVLLRADFDERASARRFTGRIGLLGAVRTERLGGDPAAWLHMSRPDAMNRIALRPLNLNALHAVISNRLGLSFRRPTMVQILETSAGNPFYALELARAMDNDDEHGAHLNLSSALRDLASARIGTLDAEVQELLLAAACVADPTVELIAAATGTDAEPVYERLEQAERNGIIGIEGHRLRFEHPLLTEASTCGHRRCGAAQCTVGWPTSWTSLSCMPGTSRLPRHTATRRRWTRWMRRRRSPASGARLPPPPNCSIWPPNSAVIRRNAGFFRPVTTSTPVTPRGPGCCSKNVSPHRVRLLPKH
jgi:hypothetical protein